MAGYSLGEPGWAPTVPDVRGRFANFATMAATSPETPRVDPKTDDALIAEHAGRYVVERSSDGSVLGLVVEMKGNPDKGTIEGVADALTRKLESKGLDISASAKVDGLYVTGHNSKAGSMTYQNPSFFEGSARDMQIERQGTLLSAFNRPSLMAEDLHEAAVKEGYEQRPLLNVAVLANGADPDKMVSRIGEAYREILSDVAQPAPAPAPVR